MKPLFIVSAIVSLMFLAACTIPGGTTTGSNASSAELSISSQTSNVATGSGVQVTTPAPNTIVTSPLTVTGQAPGPWYFEASFPVTLLDANGNIVAQSTAEAQGDWMTTAMVPFIASLTFTTPASSTGTLVLEKDNPSGEPQNAGSMSVPVQF